MVLRYKDVTNDGFFIEQVTSRPSIYLDQWTWCLLSENAELRKSFIDTARGVNATVMYSSVTLAELASIEDKKQINAIIEVMDSLDYGFSDSNPFKVTRREEELEMPEGDIFKGNNPCCDFELIKNYFLHGMNTLKPFRLSPILPKLRGEGTAEIYRDMRQSFNNLTPIIVKIRNDPEKLNKAKKRHSKKELCGKQKPYTKDIYRLAIDFIVVNENMNMPTNEWFDLLHTVVPVAYFDFVTLDKRWCHFIRTIFPLSPPNIAYVFSQSEIENFLNKIKDFTDKDGILIKTNS